MEPQSGNYEGYYYDAFGHRANLVLTMTFEGENVTGTYEAKLADYEDVSKTLMGSIDGSYSDDALNIEVTLDSGEVLTLTAQPSEAASYAAFGFYGLVNPPETGNYGGGVWIAWTNNSES